MYSIFKSFDRVMLEGTYTFGTDVAVFVPLVVPLGYKAETV